MRTLELPAHTWRIATVGAGVRASRIRVEDASLADAGNRFDVVGGGVLYVATNSRATFLETLAPLRPSPAMVSIAHQDEKAGFMGPGQIPREWRESRRMFKLGHVDAAQTLPFVDLEDLETRSELLRHLGEKIVEFGVETMDIPDVTGTNRLLTREISQWCYAQTDESGHPIYGGVRYTSRLDANEECWAVFWRNEVLFVDEQRAISVDDSNLIEVCDAWQMRVH